MTSQRKSQGAEGTHALLQASSGCVPHRLLVLRHEGRSQVRPLLGGALESAGRGQSSPPQKLLTVFYRLRSITRATRCACERKRFNKSRVAVPTRYRLLALRHEGR